MQQYYLIPKRLNFRSLNKMEFKNGFENIKIAMKNK